jgi:hypothetical protein
MPTEEPSAEPKAALLDDDGIASLLESSHRIAVVGASSNPARPSFEVFRALVAAGYECIPVNPNEVEVAGVPAVPTLVEAARFGRIDIVDVFRRPEFTLVRPIRTPLHRFNPGPHLWVTSSQSVRRRPRLARRSNGPWSIIGRARGHCTLTDSWSG